MWYIHYTQRHTALQTCADLWSKHTFFALRVLIGWMLKHKILFCWFPPKVFLLFLTCFAPYHFMGSFAIIIFFIWLNTMYSLFIKCSYCYDMLVKSHKKHYHFVLLFFSFFTLSKVLKLIPVGVTFAKNSLWIWFW